MKEPQEPVREPKEPGIVATRGDTQFIDRVSVDAEGTEWASILDLDYPDREPNLMLFQSILAHGYWDDCDEVTFALAQAENGVTVRRYPRPDADPTEQQVLTEADVTKG